MHRSQMCFITATICSSLPHSLLAAKSKVGTAQIIPMTSAHWRPVSGKPDVHYATQKGFPDGIIVLKSSDPALNDFTFRDGTINFDMKPLAEDIPGIRFASATLRTERSSTSEVCGLQGGERLHSIQSRDL